MGLFIIWDKRDAQPIPGQCVPTVGPISRELLIKPKEKYQSTATVEGASSHKPSFHGTLLVCSSQCAMKVYSSRKEVELGNQIRCHVQHTAE